MEQCRQHSRKWQRRNGTRSLPLQSGGDVVPVGCWRHRVWRRRTWCGELWWAATCVVIINGTNPENGQQHAAWWCLLTTARRLAAKVTHPPTYTHTDTHTSTHTLITSKIMWSLPRNVCVCVYWPIIYNWFSQFFCMTLSVGRLGYDGKIRVQTATCWPNTRTEGENPVGRTFFLFVKR